MGKHDNDPRGLQDVEMYFTQIRSVIKHYRKIVDTLDAMKNDKKKALEKIDLINEREGIKNSFIAKKQACRANIKLLAESLGILKERELKDLQEEYREVDTDFKSLGIMAERGALLEGAGVGRGDDMSRANNSQLLEGALSKQQETTQKLKGALQQVEQTKETGKYTAATLEEDRNKIKRIDQGLDEVESELEISRKLITRFVKRIYTDRAIIGFTTLLVLGLLGIIIYASLYPNQTLFNVPDVAIPPVITPTPTATLSVGAAPSVSPS